MRWQWLFVPVVLGGCGSEAGDASLAFQPPGLLDAGSDAQGPVPGDVSGDAGGAPDTTVPGDTAVPPDANASDDTTAPPDTSGPPDTADTTTPGDTTELGDTALPGDIATWDTTAVGDASEPGDTATPTDTAPAVDTTPADATPDATEPDAPVWQPEPVPWVDPEPPEACAEALANDWYFQFLDNLCDEKVQPSTQERDRACPVVDASPVMTLQDGSTVVYHPSSEPIAVDTEALSSLVPAGMDAAVILIKRKGGVPHYRYLGTTTHSKPFQPWSTTKFIAIANAASMLQILSSYTVGLTAMVKTHQLGDLVTSVHTYDDSPFSSNSLAAYFHDIGGRQRAHDLIHDLWLKRPAAESFGGNYGSKSPALGYAFTEPSGATLTVTPDTTSGIPNSLSALTLAEALKRIVLHREEPTQRLPGLQWKDIRVLLFGAESSPKYGPWGGMTADTAIYLQMGHDIDYIEERSHGEWVIFSKLGLGSQGQFVHVGYACLPVLDPNGDPVPSAGREVVIATHLPAGGGSWSGRDRLLAKTYRAILTRIVDGRL